MNYETVTRGLKNPYYLIFINSIYFSIFALYKSVIGLHLQQHMSEHQDFVK